MSTIEQNARIELSLNAQQAADKIKNLILEVEKLNRQLGETEKGTRQYEKLEKQLDAVGEKLKKAEIAAFDVNRVLDNLSMASVNDINKAIREMTRQMNAMDRSSDKWKYYKEHIERAREELKKINQEGKGTEVWITRFGRNISKWGRLAAGAVANVARLTETLRKFSQMAMQKEASQANLKAFSGLDDLSIAWLTEQAEQLSTTMHESGLRVRLSSQEIIDAYTLVGAASPELLKDKEALNNVTIEALRLASATRMDLNQAVDAVTVSMNSYGASAEEAARYTNVIAAGSKYGSAAVQSIAAAVKMAGAAASSAGIPIETLVGAIEALAEKGITGEVAGAGLGEFFNVLEGMTEDVRPSVVGLQTALENLQASQMNSLEMQSAFGQEAYIVAQAMISGADKVRFYTETVTGTSVAVEQAGINSSTAEARLKQANNMLMEIGIELGQKFTPIVIASTNVLTLFLRMISSVIETCEKYKTTVISLSVAIVALTAYRYKDIIASKLSYIWNEKLIGSVKSLWTAMTNNPITAIIAGFSLLIGVVTDFVSKAIETNKEIKALKNTVDSINKTSNLNVSEESARLNDLLQIAKDEKRTVEERAAAIREINRLSPEYLGNISLETINTKEAAKSIKLYMDNILALEKLKNATAKRNDFRETLQQELDNFYENKGETAQIQAYGKIKLDEFLNVDTAYKSNNPALRYVYNELYINNKGLKALVNAYKEVDALVQKTNSEIIKNQVELSKHTPKKNVESSVYSASGNSDIAYRIDNNDYIQDAEDAIEEQTKRLKIIEQISYVKGEKSLEDHLKSMQRIEESAIVDKQKLYLKDSDKWNELELERLQNNKKYEEEIKAIKEKYIEEVEQFRNKYLQKSDNEKMQEEISLLEYYYEQGDIKEQEFQEIKDAISKKYTEKAEQFKNKYIPESNEEIMQKELSLLEKFYSDKLVKEEDYQKIKDAINKKYTEQARKREYKVWSELDSAGRLERVAKVAQETWSQVNALMQVSSELMQANMDLEIDKINQRYDVQLKAAEGNAELTERIEAKKEAEIAKVKNEYNKRQMKMQIAQAMATSAVGLLNAWVSAMRIDYAPFNFIVGGLLSGAILSQTAIQIAAIKKQHEAQAEGYYSGGYTSRTLRDTDEAGVVHGNEFVVNARAVRNPAIRPMLDFIDNAQRNNVVANITSRDIAAAAVAGIYPGNAPSGGTAGDASVMIRFYSVLEKLEKKLDKPIVAETYITGKGGSKQAQDLYDKMISNSKL